MRVFKTESAFDAESQEWAEIYYIDDQEVDQETYFEQLELEPYGEVETEEQCNCEECQDCEPESQEECQCPDCDHDRAIRECLDIVFDENACVDCMIKAIVELAFKARAIGYHEAKTEMRAFLDEE